MPKCSCSASLQNPKNKDPGQEHAGMTIRVNSERYRCRFDHQRRIESGSRRTDENELRSAKKHSRGAGSSPKSSRVILPFSQTNAHSSQIVPVWIQAQLL